MRLTGIDYPPSDEAVEFFDYGLDRRIDAPPQRDTEVLDPAQPE